MLALHGWVIDGVNLHGSEWFVFPLGWLVAEGALRLAGIEVNRA